MPVVDGCVSGPSWTGLFEQYIESWSMTSYCWTSYVLVRLVGLVDVRGI